MEEHWPCVTAPNVESLSMSQGAKMNKEYWSIHKLAIIGCKSIHTASLQYLAQICMM